MLQTVFFRHVDLGALPPKDLIRFGGAGFGDIALGGYPYGVAFFVMAHGKYDIELIDLVLQPGAVVIKREERGKGSRVF